MGFDFGGWVRHEWADAKYVLSQRSASEIVAGIFLFTLVIASVVMVFIFTMVAPPGDLGSSGTSSVNAARARRHVQQQLFKRSLPASPDPKPDQAHKFASGSGVEDALMCVGIGSDVLENLGTPYEAAQEAVACLGLISIPEQETLARLEKDLATALTTGNQHAAVNTLMKIVHYGVVEEAKSIKI